MIFTNSCFWITSAIGGICNYFLAFPGLSLCSLDSFFWCMEDANVKEKHHLFVMVLLGKRLPLSPELSCTRVSWPTFVQRPVLSPGGRQPLYKAMCFAGLAQSTHGPTQWAGADLSEGPFFLCTKWIDRKGKNYVEAYITSRWDQPTPHN